MTFVNEDLLVKVAGIIGGEDAVTVVEFLESAGESTEDEISRGTGIQLNDVRRVLYKLYNHSIVTNVKFRDRTTGWFVFRWGLQSSQVAGFTKVLKKKVLDRLERRLKYEKGHDFFSCFSPGCDRVTFEEAVENVFRCSKCGGPLKRFDNDLIVRALEERVELLKEELG